MSAEAMVAVVTGIVASAEDLWRRQVSNWTTLTALAAGLVCQVVQHGWMGVLWGLGGAAAGFAVFLVFYWLGGMGGGDIKLMAAFGALLGTKGILVAALWTAGVGGIIALFAVAWGALRGAVRSRRGHEVEKRPETIPYAPAITLGVWLAMVQLS